MDRANTSSVTVSSRPCQCWYHLDRGLVYKQEVDVDQVDETHVLVKKDYLEEIKDLLQEEVRGNSPVPSGRAYLDYCTAFADDRRSWRRTRISKIRACDPTAGFASTSEPIRVGSGSNFGPRYDPVFHMLLRDGIALDECLADEISIQPYVYTERALHLMVIM